MMMGWKYRDNAKCPRCNEVEDTHHVEQCQEISNKNSYLKATEEIKKWLSEMTSPRIKSVVMTHLNTYQRDIKLSGFRTRDMETRQVSEEQDALGKRSFGEGFLVKG